MGFWSSLKKGLKKVVKVAAPLAAAYFTGGAAAGALGRFGGGGGRFATAFQRGRTIFEKAKPFVKGVQRLRAARRSVAPSSLGQPPAPVAIGGHAFHSQLMTLGPNALIPLRAKKVMPDPSAGARLAMTRYMAAGGARIRSAQLRARGYRPRIRYRLRRRRRY